MMHIKSKKKNAMLQHKRLDEERKRKAEEDAAAVYAEFVEDFGGGGGSAEAAGAAQRDGAHRGLPRRQRQRQRHDNSNGGGSGDGGGPRRSVSPGLHAASPRTGPLVRPAAPPTAAAAAAFFGGGSSSSEDERGDGRAAGRAGAAKKKKNNAAAPRHFAAAPVGTLPPLSASAAESPIASPPPPPPPPPPPARKIDRVVEAMRREQERRQQGRGGDRHHHHNGGHRGGGGYSDPHIPASASAAAINAAKYSDSTNLYIGNVAPDVTEAALLHEFAPFGAIASVKVLWPRDEAEARARGGRNCGFVAFMRRSDAELALARMDGVTLAGRTIRVEWSRAVELPAMPMWAGRGGAGGGGGGAPTDAEQQQQQQQQEQQWLLQQQHSGPPYPMPPHLAQQQQLEQQQLQQLAPEAFRHRAVLAPRVDRALAAMHAAPRGVPDLVVLPPADDRQRFVLDSVAFYVYRDGPAFERALAQSRRGDPDFAFLLGAPPGAAGGGGGSSGCGGGGYGTENCDNNTNNHQNKPSPEHLYYRWRLYSLSQGDSLERWRVEPFVMVRGGPRWVPPPTTALAAGVVEGAAVVAAGGGGGGGATAAAACAGDGGGGDGAVAAAGGGEAGAEATKTAAATAASAAPAQQQRQDAATAAAAEAGERPLAPGERARLEALLSGLTASRASVAEAMAFCLDHSECAAAVSRVLCASLAAPPLPPAAKGEEEEDEDEEQQQQQQRPPLPPGARVARLFVISDVLHNAAGAPARGAQRFRARLLEALPAAFRALGRVLRAEAAAGRTIARAKMRQWVGAVMSGWRDRGVFPVDYVDGLAFLFEVGLPPAPPQPAEGAEGGGAAPPWHKAARAELDRQCLAAGLPLTVARHGVRRCAEAMAAVTAWQLAEGVSRPALVAAAAAAARTASGAAAAAAAPPPPPPPPPAPAPTPAPTPTSQWEAVDADEERRRLQSLPVSKLLEQQQQQERQQRQQEQQCQQQQDREAKK